MAKIEVLISNPKTTTFLPVDPPEGDWSVPNPGSLDLNTIILAGMGFIDTGSHVCIRLTNEAGEQTVWGLHPVSDSSIDVMLFGGAVRIDDEDASKFVRYDQLVGIATRHPGLASYVQYHFAHDETQISDVQLNKIADFVNAYRDASAFGANDYSAFQSDDTNCLGFVQRCLTYAGVPFGINPPPSVLGDPGTWAPSSMVDCFTNPGDSVSFSNQTSATQDMLVAGPGGSTLTATSGTAYLLGNEGADELRSAGTAHAKLVGGGGDDTYELAGADDVVVEQVGGGFDTLLVHEQALRSTGYLLGENLEKAILDDDAGNANVTGNAQNNYLLGNNGRNTLNGGDGFDILEGGDGDDTYVLLDQSGAGEEPDDVVEQAGGGNDTVVARMFEYTLRADVENLTMSSGPQGNYVIGRGNELANNMVLIGADVQGQLFGYAGDDNLTGATGGDYLVGGSGHDRLFGENGDDTLDGNDGESDELYGGAGADQLFADQDLVVGGAGNDRIWGGAGSTFQWGQGDGLDSVYTTSEADTIKFTPDESGPLYSVTASFDGDDMVLSTGNGEGVTVKNWKSWGGKCNIELPNGDIVTPTELEGFLHPAVTGWSYSGGVFDGSAFETVVRSQHGVFNDNANLWQDLAGWSLFDWVWQSGTQSGTYTGRFQGDKPIYSWGSSGGMHVPGATNMSDPYSALWHELQYDFWQKDGGGWEFAITSASAGYGGQVNYYYDSVEERWEGYPVNKLYSYSDYNSRTEYEISPAVTSVVLYDGGSSAMTTAASRQTSDADMLFGVGAFVDTQEVLVRQVLDGQSQELAGASVWVETEDAAPASADLFYASEGAWLRLGSGVPTAAPDAQVSTQPVVLAAYDALYLPSELARVSIMPVPTKEFLLVA
jgi:hypothetical protein